MNNESPTKWDARFLELASLIASWSKDTSTKVGCVVVGPTRDIRATGYNGLPRFVNDNVSERLERPAKYLWTEHAERNAFYQASRYGISLEGCSLYSTLFPCADCARGIIQVGIKEVISPTPVHNERWNENWDVTGKMFEEAGIMVYNYDAVI